MTAVLQHKDSANGTTLYMALELSNKKWKLGFSNGEKNRLTTIAAGDWIDLHKQMDLAKQKLRLPEDCRIVSCYDAGRDGFWIHRGLEAEGIENHVVDSSSIEVNRRKRRAKTDKVDVKALLRLLQRYWHGDREAMKQVNQLRQLKGVGCQSSWILVMEFFSWRDFYNQRQLGACTSLTPTPYASGDSEREQGISKAGNRQVRSLMIELSWLWLRYQPDSTLTQWFQQRFAGGGKRMRRIGIVAMARKLLIALWRYVKEGMVPEGAVFKVV